MDISNNILFLSNPSLKLAKEKKGIQNKKTVRISNNIVYFFAPLILYCKIYLMWMFACPSFLLVYWEQNLSLPQEAEWA